MRVEIPRTNTVVRAGLPKVEPWMKQAVESSFLRVKDAILTGNFSAFLAEFHPEVLKRKKVEDIAILFGELKQMGVKDWELDAKMSRDSDGVGARIKNAPADTVAYYMFNGKDQLKLVYLGKFSFS